MAPHRLLGQHHLRLGTLLVLFCLGASVRAQESTREPGADQDLIRLDNALRRMEAHLESLPAYQATLAQSWQLEGRDKGQGGSEVTLRVSHNGPFRLDIRAKQEPSSSLSCVGKEGRITRLFELGTTRLLSVGQGEALESLLDDHMAASVLSGSGLDLLCHEHAHKFIMSKVSDVEYLGEDELEQGKALHFRCQWEGREPVELWILSGDEPLLAKKKRTIALPDGEQKLILLSEFAWKRQDAWPANLFQLDVPDNVIKVDDIYSYLIEGGTRQFVGKAVPSVALSDLSGEERDICSHAGESVVCLFFWTSWATASDAQRQDVMQLIADFRDTGVEFYAVNVGEPKEVVASFVGKTGYKGTVLLDTEKKLTEALRITSLPVCVLVGKDGKVASVHVGSTEEDREQVRQDLKSMLQTKESPRREG